MGANSSDLRGLAADQVVSLIAEYFQQRGYTLTQAFSFLDRDASNYVSWDEFVRGINICLENTGHHRVSNSELWPIFKRFDRNNDDRISLDEFSAQFYPARRGSSARSWYEDDMRLRGSGRTIGFGPPVMSTNLMAERRVDDVIVRIASAIARTGFSPLQLFQKVDLDGNGRLSWTELERVICSFQPDLSVSERQAIFRRFDADGTGDIDVNEFCNTLNQTNPSAMISVEAKVKALGEKFRATGQTVAEAFRVFDRNYDGFLTRDEWFRAIRTFDWQLTDADIDAVYRRFDLNGDGLMSIQEFDTFFRDAIDRSGTYSSVSPTYQHGVSPVGTPHYVGGTTYIDPLASHYGASSNYGVMPTYVQPPVEQPWETEVLDTVRSCLSVGRSGMSITEVYRRLDIDHNNAISPIEFQRVIQTYRADLSAAHINSLFNKVNTSGSGQINLSEWIRRFG